MAGPPPAPDATLWLQCDDYVDGPLQADVTWPDSSGNDYGFGAIQFTASGAGPTSNPWPTSTPDLNGHDYLLFRDIDAALGEGAASTFTALFGGFGAITFGAYPDMNDLYRHE